MSQPVAIIPAAGLSSRMGEFKPLLPLGDGTVVSQCIGLFRSVGIEEIIVVTGKRCDEVADVARCGGATPVHNPEFEQGMFSSVLTGVRALPDGDASFCVLPVDIPLVRRETVLRLMEDFKRESATVLYPRFFGERGHPPFISRALVPDILNHDGTGGLRSVLMQHEAGARDLDVGDYGITHDLDYPADYELATSLFGREYPTPEECEQLLSMHAISDHIAGHCRAVSRVAVALCNALNATKGLSQLDGKLVRSAALTHDIGKGNGHHEEIGGAILRAEGFPVVAEIVAAHFDVFLSPEDCISEKEVVFLADKLVRCHAPVLLEGRYMEKIEMYRSEPGAKEAILGRLHRARLLMERFDRETGMSAELLAQEALS